MLQNRFKKIFTFVVLTFLTLLLIIFYMFRFTNNKSDQMLHHKSTLTKEFSFIRYKITESHLWFMEYLSGETKEEHKIHRAFKKIEKSFQILIELETTNYKIHHSKHRDDKFVIDTLKALELEYINFKEITIQHIIDQVDLYNFNDNEYDLIYQRLMDNLENFDRKLNTMFLKVNEEFRHFLHKIYILYSLLIIFTITGAIVLYKREKEKFQRIEKQDKIIANQYKYVAIAEMIDAIAHQWKTPLSIINLKAQMLEYEIQDNTLDHDKIKETSTSIIQQINHLNETVNEFRKFFRPNDNLELISLKKLIESVLILLKDELIKNTIQIEVLFEDIYNIPLKSSEFKHVIINLIQNSRDAFNYNKIENRKITIDASNQNQSVVLKVCDNAGGIPENIIKDIFTPHFTTKKDIGGTGIGLYLTKQIIEKNNAEIEVENRDNGVCFYIILNKEVKFVQ